MRHREFGKPTIHERDKFENKTRRGLHEKNALRFVSPFFGGTVRRVFMLQHFRSPQDVGLKETGRHCAAFPPTVLRTELIRVLVRYLFVRVSDLQYSTALYPILVLVPHGTSAYGYGYKYGISRIRLVSHRAIP